MAKAMVVAVRSHAKEEESADDNGNPRGRGAQELQQVLRELMACGSGYFTGRRDAACVGRTMMQMVHEFGARESAAK